MPSYTPIIDHGEGSNGPYRWLVKEHHQITFLGKDTIDYIGPLMTEAEAHVISFALQTIADGNTLLSADPTGAVTAYQGPTKGIKP